MGPPRLRIKTAEGQEDARRNRAITAQLKSRRTPRALPTEKAAASGKAVAEAAAAVGEAAAAEAACGVVVCVVVVFVELCCV